MLIYILEDEESIRELESYALEKSGFNVQSFENAQDFYKALEQHLPDLILLDIMLPGDDGLTVLKNLRQNPTFAKIPIIIISAKTTELDRVKGLDLGANDYMCKPFGIMEMVSRVRARLRDVQENSAKQLEFEGISVSDKTRTVTADGKRINLTYKEFELLKLLVENPNTVLRRDYILNRIWGHASTGRTLDVHIRSLRNKLGKYGTYIVTVRGVGYKMDKDG